MKKARHTTEDASGLGIDGDGRLDLQTLQRAQRSTESIVFPAVGPLVTVDGLQLAIEVAKLVKAILKQITQAVGGVDGFFDAGFLAVGGWFFGGGLCDHDGFPFGLWRGLWCRI